MDFQRLPRRALQLLCKRNKIPANTANIAMADALRSLQTVEGLHEIQQGSQTPIKIKSATRPTNPPRSCQSNSSLISIVSENAKKKKRASQECSNSPMSKRSRTASPRKASSTKKENEEEEDPIGKLPPFNTLVPCREKSVCLKTYSRKTWHCSGKVIEEVNLKIPMLGCTSSVQQNTNTKLIRQELPNSSVLKKRRIVSPCRASSREEEDDKKDGDPVRNSLPFNTLVPCTERPLCLKTYCRRRRHWPMSACSSGVQQNATAFESAESAIGGVVEYSKVGEERRRSIGVQVDIRDLDNSVMDILAIGDKTATNLSDNRVSNHCVDLFKKDQETTNSCLLPTEELIDKECIDSLILQNLHLASHLPEPSPGSSNMPSNIRDLIRSQESLLPETGDAIVRSHELNCGPVLENREEERNESFDIHSNGGEGTDPDRENGEVKSAGGKTGKQNEKKRDLSGLSLRKLRLLYKENKEGESRKEEEKVHCEEEKQSIEKRRLDGLSLRMLKYLYKNKVTSNRSSEMMTE